MEASQPKGFSLQEWFWAIRPKTLSTAIVPFLAGTMLAYALNHAIVWHQLFFAWLSAVFIQIGTNFTNDAYDFMRGTDTTASLGPQRATRKGMLAGRLTFDHVRNAGIGFFALALLFGIPLMLKGGIPVAIVLLFSVLSGYLYTGGGYPLAYHGLGDLFVIIFYGFVATNAAFWLQTGEIDAKSMLLSLQIGCLCTSMIAINNLRDVFDDAKTSKKTLPVRFGVGFGRLEITIMLVLPLVANLFWPWALVAWLPLLSAPLAIKIIRHVWTQNPGQDYNHFLAMSGANMLLFCLFQAVGFAWV